MSTKICTKCNQEKSRSEFYKVKDTKDGLTAQCKACRNEAHQKWKASNPSYHKAWRECNPEKVRSSVEAWKAANKPRVKSNNQKWSSENRGRINDKRNQRYKEDLNYRLSRVLRSRLKAALQGSYKNGSAIKDLGCSIVELRIHLENKFKDGMDWDNYGLRWHIDHVLPLASFDLSNIEQLKAACHYSNLQPLWVEDNLRKGDRLPS